MTHMDRALSDAARTSQRTPELTAIKPSILDTIGNTPIVKINNLAPEGVEVFVKLEAFNPMGSVKDRLALGVIEDAEASGALKPGQTVIEATSGNTVRRTATINDTPTDTSRTQSICC